MPPLSEFFHLHREQDSLEYWDRLARNIVPRQEIVPDILFLGKKNQEGLIHLAHDAVDSYVKGFEVPNELWAFWHKAIDFSVAAYDHISTHREMQRANNQELPVAHRLTGESYACHNIRGMLRLMTFYGAYEADSAIYKREISLATRRGDQVNQEAKELSVLAAIALLFHDFPSDEEKFSYEFSTDHNHLKHKLTLKIKTGSPLLHEEEKVTAMTFDCSSDLWDKLRLGIKALKKVRIRDQVGQDDPIMTAASQLMQIYKIADTNPDRSRIGDLMPLFSHFLAIAELSDKYDNLTVAFQKENDTYVPMKGKKLASLIKTTEMFYASAWKMLTREFIPPLFPFQQNLFFKFFNPALAARDYRRYAHENRSLYDDTWRQVKLPFENRGAQDEFYLYFADAIGFPTDDVQIFDFPWLGETFLPYIDEIRTRGWSTGNRAYMAIKRTTDTIFRSPETRMNINKFIVSLFGQLAVDRVRMSNALQQPSLTGQQITRSYIEFILHMKEMEQERLPKRKK